MTVTCADCGSTQSVPPLPPGGSAECHRCDRELARTASASGNDIALVCAIAMVILLPPAVFMPLMDSTIRHLVYDESRLVSSVPVIYSQVWFPFAFGFLFFAFLFPAVRAMLLIASVGSLRAGWKIPQRGRVFRWSEELRIWSMTEVVVIAGVIAYFRAGVSAEVAVRVGAWSYLGVAALAFTIDRTLDRRSVWNAILPSETIPPGTPVVSCSVCELASATRKSGDPCPRCGATLDHNISHLFAPALGAVAAAILLSLPAYSASIIVNDQLTGVLEHTVIGTVQLLADRGFWQGSVVVLVAGVFIPLAELCGLAWLLTTVRFPSKRGLVIRTRVYRVLHRLVRWPMIIPFIAALAAPIVDFRGIDDIVAGPGATPLFLLIALMMLAVRLFEPRMMWKTAGETG
ncbi:MAG TPA: paraquat-inducible protein A [Thermoanaerobaculia bacterium]|nr:paraquat-inducible protein A [Thermoanaerobaculia bacterium]